MAPDEKLIADYRWQNGRWGSNYASLRRCRDGYLVGGGFNDPVFHRSPVEAKQSFRMWLEKPAAEWVERSLFGRRARLSFNR